MDKKSLLTGKLEKKKRIIRSTIWSKVLYAADIWTLSLAYRKRLEAFRMWIWERMER